MSDRNPARKRIPALLLAVVSVLLLAQPLVTLAQFDDTTPVPASAPEAVATPAQDTAIPQVHVVQSGDTLFAIAQTYSVTVASLLAVNNLASADLLQVGQQLIIPGGEGEVVAGQYRVKVGDTLRSIAADFNTTTDALVTENRLIRPDQLLAGGQTIAVAGRTGTDDPRPQTGRPYLVQPGDTLLSLAAQNGVNPALLAAVNGLPAAARLTTGQRLRIPDETVIYRDLPGGWVDIQVRPEGIGQGDTVSVYVRHLSDERPSGRLGEIPLQFTPMVSGYVALAGIDAFTAPGAYELEVSSSAEPEPLRALVSIAETGFDTQYIDVGQALDGLLDPNLRADEDAFLKTYFDEFTEPQQWEGIFQTPVAAPLISAVYGGRRSYNGGPISIYHTGIDYAAPEGTEVLAPAAGTVVFSDTLTLRGGVLLIDHGLGVMTGYYHLIESLVEPGEKVVAGQPIAKIGSTGLSSGPHLHWDLRILNVPVDGTKWTEQVFP